MQQQHNLIDEIKAAAYIGLSVAYLRASRCHGTTANRTAPPPHFKIGRTVRYSRADLDQWLSERRVDPHARAARGK